MCMQETGKPCSQCGTRDGMHFVQGVCIGCVKKNVKTAIEEIKRQEKSAASEFKRTNSYIDSERKIEHVNNLKRNMFFCTGIWPKTSE